MAASAKALDMTDVKEGGQFNKKRIPAGDYLARVVKVDDAKVKKQGSDNYGADQWVFTLQIVKVPSAKYPYYTTLVPNQLWKVRNLAIATGMAVPKKRFKLDPNKLVGKLVGVSIQDAEYEGREQSEIDGVFPSSELEDYADATAPVDDEDVEDTEVDEEEEEPQPAPRRAVKKAAAAPEPDEEEDEEDEEEAAEGDAFDAMDRNELKVYLKTADSSFIAKKSQSDDDLRVLARAVDANVGEEEEDEEEEEVAPPPPARKRAAKKAAPAVTEDELDELDLDDL
jgi:hypothetical protein